jgi:hypothetical protein
MLDLEEYGSIAASYILIAGGKMPEIVISARTGQKSK